MSSVAYTHIFLAEDVSSWSAWQWVGVIISVIVGTALFIGLTLLAITSMDNCIAAVAVLVAFAFAAYIVWTWWLGPFVSHL